jgi:hypothetical protein
MKIAVKVGEYIGILLHCWIRYDKIIKNECGSGHES